MKRNHGNYLFARSGTLCFEDPGFASMSRQGDRVEMKGLREGRTKAHYCGQPSDCVTGDTSVDSVRHFLSEKKAYVTKHQASEGSPHATNFTLKMSNWGQGFTDNWRRISWAKRTYAVVLFGFMRCWFWSDRDSQPTDLNGRTALCIIVSRQPQGWAAVCLWVRWKNSNGTIASTRWVVPSIRLQMFSVGSFRILFF